MKALTLWQPWASLIVLRHKCFETRSWKTDRLIGERLAIHAALRTPSDLANELMDELAKLAIDPVHLPLGAVLGTGVVTAYHRTEVIAPSLPSPELAFGNYAPGRWAWRIDDIEMLPEPWPARGRQGIWEWAPPTVPN